MHEVITQTAFIVEELTQVLFNIKRQRTEGRRDGPMSFANKQRVHGEDLPCGQDWQNNLVPVVKGPRKEGHIPTKTMIYPESTEYPGTSVILFLVQMTVTGH